MIILNTIIFFFQFCSQAFQLLTLTALQTNPQKHKDTHIHVKRDSDVLSPLPQVSQWDNNLEPSNEFQFLFDASLINRPTFGSNIP